VIHYHKHKEYRRFSKMGYPVAGVGSCGGYGGAMGAAAFALVLFILLVIILRAGY
jgi:uncharacterized membrane protein